MWAEDHRLASAVMILPCSIVGSLSHRITLSLLFVTLLHLLAHWIRATSCIPGLRSSCFCFIHVPFLLRSRLMEPWALKTQLWLGFYCCSPGPANYPSLKAKTPLLGRIRQLRPAITADLLSWRRTSQLLFLLESLRSWQETCRCKVAHKDGYKSASQIWFYSFCLFSECFPTID